MRLYNLSSSESIASSVKSFVRSIFKANSKVEVLVAGRKIGDLCRILRGDGSSTFVPCAASFHFLCEYDNNEIIASCEPYYSSDYGNYTGISDPVDCIIGAEIMGPAITIGVPNDVPIENVVGMGNYDFNSAHLPIGLAARYPNLQYLESSGNKVEEITRDNFLGLFKLVEIHLESNLITSILSDAFLDVPNLKVLHLGNNLILKTEFSYKF